MKKYTDVTFVKNINMEVAKALENDIDPHVVLGALHIAMHLCTEMLIVRTADTVEYNVGRETEH